LKRCSLVEEEIAQSIGGGFQASFNRNEAAVLAHKALLLDDDLPDARAVLGSVKGIV
jgi:hypothetical protein